MQVAAGEPASAGSAGLPLLIRVPGLLPTTGPAPRVTALCGASARVELTTASLLPCGPIDSDVDAEPGVVEDTPQVPHARHAFRLRVVRRVHGLAHNLQLRLAGRHGQVQLGKERCTFAARPPASAHCSCIASQPNVLEGNPGGGTLEVGHSSTSVQTPL